MSPRKASPTEQPPALEDFYNVGKAAVRLNLKTKAEHEDGSTKGERWLRDGCNRPEDGSQGDPFPHHRMNGCLMFSDSDLAEIAARHRNAPTRYRRSRRTRPVVKSAEVKPTSEAELQHAA
jgi:hypothetical protein